VVTTKKTAVLKSSDRWMPMALPTRPTVTPLKILDRRRSAPREPARPQVPASVIKPDILILDEILGVGDAYFSHKSFERMRELCLSGGDDAAAGDARRLRGDEPV